MDDSMSECMGLFAMAKNMKNFTFLAEDTNNGSHLVDSSPNEPVGVEDIQIRNISRTYPASSFTDDYGLTNYLGLVTMEPDNNSVLDSIVSGDQGSMRKSPSGGELDDARIFLRTYLVPAICAFGIIGNTLSIIILSRKKLKSVDSTENLVNISLSALALSDLAICLSLLPHGILTKEFQLFYRALTFELVYRTYGEAFTNVFILASTWLTVSMAMARYLAICHPFRARHLIGLTATRLSIIFTFLLSILLNIPRFFEWRIEKLECLDGSFIYGQQIGWSPNQMFWRVWNWTYASVGIFLPLTLLAFCNICLVRALRESSKLRRRYRVPASHVDANHRITSILVAIAVMHILLVAPSEILRFLNWLLLSKRGPPKHYRGFSIAHEVTNLFQTINYSCDFVLYFVLNNHFRAAMRELFSLVIHLPMRCCKRKSRHTYRNGLNRSHVLSKTQHTILSVNSSQSAL